MGVRYDGGLVADPQGDPLFVDLVYGDSFTGAFLRASIAVGIVAGVSASAVPIVVLAAAVLVAIWKLGRP